MSFQSNDKDLLTCGWRIISMPLMQNELGTEFQIQHILRGKKPHWFLISERSQTLNYWVHQKPQTAQPWNHGLGHEGSWVVVDNWTCVFSTCFSQITTWHGLLFKIIIGLPQTQSTHPPVRSFLAVEIIVLVILYSLQ